MPALEALSKGLRVGVLDRLNPPNPDCCCLPVAVSLRYCLAGAGRASLALLDIPGSHHPSMAAGEAFRFYRDGVTANHPKPASTHLVDALIPFPLVN